MYDEGRGEALREKYGAEYILSSWISDFVKLGSIETDILKEYPSAAYTYCIGLQVAATEHVM